MREAVPPDFGEQLFKLAAQAMEDSERWFGDTPVVHSLAYNALCYGGEVGEFQNIVKKIERGSLDPRDPKVFMKLCEELTDGFVYWLCCVYLLRMDPYKFYQKIRAQNEARFTAERQEREAHRA